MNAAHRLISQDFKHDLTDANGILSPVLSLVKADDTLSLSIRSGYINVYYRGGSLAKITDLGGHSYRFEFDGNYLRSSHHSLLSANLGTSPGPPVVRCAADAAAWVSRIPQMKFAMDLWFGEHPKQEREYQQLVERTNNANYATDYFVCDIEYTNPDCPELRADMVALRWPSTRETRKQASAGLAIVEMKFADGAVQGASGIADHIRKLNTAITSKRLSMSDFAEEMREVFNTRVEFGLIHCHSEKGKMAKRMESVLCDPWDFILLIADHDPDTTALLSELQRIESIRDLQFNVKVACASFMGYGLYDRCIYPLDAFMDRLVHTSFVEGKSGGGECLRRAFPS